VKKISLEILRYCCS